MEFKKYVKIGITAASLILVFAALMTMTIFALDPSQPIIFTNALMMVLIIVQLLVVNMLMYIYERMEGGRRR
jgi:membrane protein YdbS with pleckstrin-like domain